MSGGWMTIKSVCNNSFNPAPGKNSGVSLNGSRLIEIKISINENPWTSLRRKSCELTSSSSVIGFLQIQASNVNHSAHIKRGPSRAAHVAAKRYLKGRDSPPKATTYCIVVSLTTNLLDSAKKGIAIQK